MQNQATGTDRGPWSREEVLRHCRERTLTNVENLAHITGLGENVIYDAIKRNEWTLTRVLRVGRLIKIPTADVIAALGLDQSDSAA